MTVVGISMVRDEADIVAATVGHMAGQVDHVIVADNLSIDGTRDILDALPVTVLDDPEPGYYQSAKMTELARMAREEFGADWIVPFDADEWWHCSGGRVSDALEALGPDVDVAGVVLFDHVATGADPAEANPVQRIRWRRRDPGALSKVAVRAIDGLVIEQGNHGAHMEDRYVHQVVESRLQIRHFPWRSPEQMVRKVRNGAQAYAATNLPEEFGDHWRSYGRILDESGEEAVHDVFRSWFWVPDPHMDPSLILDPAPRPSHAL